MLAMIVSEPARAATLSDAEAAFLDQLVTASVVLEQRCVGYEVDEEFIEALTTRTEAFNLQDASVSAA